MTEENQGIVGSVTSATSAALPPRITKLIGTYERNLDSKQRIGLPHQFRDKLGNGPLILVRWLKRSLAIFPEINWLPLAESVDALELYTEEGMTVRNHIYAHSREVSVDKEGRIIVPPDMVDYARLDGKVMLLGDWDKITVWNSVYYKDQLAIDDVTFTERFPSVLQLAKGQKTLESFVAEQKSKKSDA